ncbi:MAG: DUF3109 family protein [Porphyromonas somerae]|uniref:DUF3109 family protein n=1 Tax=Porphyromonas somerae TaxID=322095 RepID=UPI0026E938AC|nr:DUF3109 family protein [Porphyromonas somerae]MDD7558334.1 DUF3109 family protein [Porphyromonas somerae]MDY5815426.1 DUF3109 family protein [Porphyromonas somerae]
MIIVGDIIVSSEVLETFFCCDLEACHGACCIEGESGAPIEREEVEMICNAFPNVQRLLPEKHLKYIEEHGLMYEDADGDLVTQIIDGEQCVFTCLEKDNSVRCAFEKCYTEGIDRSFYKPISCHLYPIRVSQLRDGKKALNYSRWVPICEPARELGRKLNLRVYQFLKEPLIRAYGKEWYEQLVEQAELYFQNKEKRRDESQ